jgi:tetratricopeptide (TPR) repeat protein
LYFSNRIFRFLYIRIAMPIVCAIIAFVTFCPATTQAQAKTGNGLSLAEAIEQSAAELMAKLPPGTRVAIVSFDTEHKNLSGSIMDERGGALAAGGLEVADRRNLELVYKELNFQMSGDVNDETAVSIGKFLAAEYVISGQLLKAGGSYRYRVSGIKVETAVLEIPVRLDVRNNRALRTLISDLQNAKIPAPAAYRRPAAPPGTAGAFLDRGILFASRGDFDMAIEDFTEAIRLNPGMSLAYLQRGKALLARQANITGIDEDIDEDFEFDWTVGKRDKTADDDRALADFTKAIELAPNLFAAWRYRGGLYTEIREYDKAIADHIQHVRLDPNSTGAYMSRGIAYAGKGDYDRAIADYDRAVKLNPNFATAYNNRGNAYSDTGDHDRAIADYDRAISLDPNYAAAYTNRGIAYADKGDYDRAIADHTQAIRLDPNEAVAYTNRGSAYHRKGDYDRAIADYTQAIRLDPNYAMAYNNRGLAYHYGKWDRDRARADFTEAIRLDPNYADAYAHRGDLYGATPDYDAIADYTQAIRLNPNNVSAYVQRGWNYYWSNRSGDLDRAIADYTQAIRLDPNNALAYDYRGYVYSAKGDYRRARADWEKALQIDPNFNDPKINLENLRKKGH